LVPSFYRFYYTGIKTVERLTRHICDIIKNDIVADYHGRVSKGMDSIRQPAEEDHPGRKDVTLNCTPLAQILWMMISKQIKDLWGCPLLCAINSAPE